MKLCPPFKDINLHPEGALIIISSDNNFTKGGHKLPVHEKKFSLLKMLILRVALDQQYLQERGS